jgi:hypothetical protein
MYDFPEKDKKRAITRFHKFRVRNKAKRIAEYNKWFEKPQYAIKLADHLQWCSCDLCSMKRKTYGPPISERRQQPLEEDYEYEY